MEKIYVVKFIKFGEGAIVTSKIFADKAKAEAYCEYFNEYFEDTKYLYHYWVSEYEICQVDAREFIK